MTATLRTSGALRPATGSTWDLVEFEMRAGHPASYREMNAVTLSGVPSSYDA
jgi:hypothetical protein